MAPTTILEEVGAILKVWSFDADAVHSRPVLPVDSGLLAYRAAVRAAGAEEPHPVLRTPSAPTEADAAIWADEHYNNALAYGGQVGSIDLISCLDALLFAEQNARVPQLERPTEFLASVLDRGAAEGAEVVIVFGAGDGPYVPRSVYGFDVVDDYLAQGWRFRYVLHNHTLQANGDGLALGVPVPSTSDVELARSLAEGRRLEGVRVTNGFYSFRATIAELNGFRTR